MIKASIDIVKKAGSYLIDNFKKDLSLLARRGYSKEIVTEYDKGSDKIIIEELERAFPEHNICTEESGMKDKGSEYTWHVDSLDGTGNYAMGNPIFAVSLALVHKDEVVLGVVYAPALDELYTSEKGKGAYLNGHKINVSDVDDISKVYVVACEGADPNTNRITQAYSNILPNVKDMRKLGAASLEGSFVATGRSDAYISFNLPIYDIAAAVLIAREAGAKATDFSGADWTVKQSDVVISNGKVHDAVLKLLRGDD